METKRDSDSINDWTEIARAVVSTDELASLHPDCGDGGPDASVPHSQDDLAFAGEVEKMCAPDGPFDSGDGANDDGKPSPQSDGSRSDRMFDKPLAEYSSREIGMEGERLAASYLVNRGFGILDRNWRTKVGEADIVALAPSDDDAYARDSVVLVEVKTRLALGDARGQMPELAVDRRKRLRYRRMALMYLALHPECDSIRFDVIALNIIGERTARLRHLVSAFSWDE